MAEVNILFVSLSRSLTYKCDILQDCLVFNAYIRYLSETGGEKEGIKARKNGEYMFCDNVIKI